MALQVVHTFRLGGARRRGLNEPEEPEDGDRRDPPGPFEPEADAGNALALASQRWIIP